MKLNAAFRLLSTQTISAAPTGQAQMQSTRPQPLETKKPVKKNQPNKFYKVNNPQPDKEYKLNEEWFDKLSKPEQEDYVEEHPGSKYADDIKSEDNKPKSRPTDRNQPVTVTRDQKTLPKSISETQKQKPAATPAPKTEQEKFEQNKKDLLKPEPNSAPEPKAKGKPEAKDKSGVDSPEPKPQSKVPVKAPTKSSKPKITPEDKKPSSPQRKTAASKVKAEAKKKGLIRGIIRDGGGLLSGIGATHRLLNGKTQEGDVKKIASMVGNILGSAAMAGVLGASGGVGLVAFMAVKHLGAPAIYSLVKKGVVGAGSSIKKLGNDKPRKKGWSDEEAEANKYGYWKNGDWVPLSKHEYDTLSDEEIDRRQRQGGPGTKNSRHGVHSSLTLSIASRLITAETSDKLDDELVGKVIDAIADYVESGDIPDAAWTKAQEELDQQSKDSK